MISWIKRNAHVIIAVAGGVGVVLTTVAANTTNLLPTTVGAWMTAVGSIIATTIAVLAGGKVATKERLRLKLAK